MNEFGKYISFLSIFTLIYILFLVLGHLLVTDVINKNTALNWSNANPNIEKTLKSTSGLSAFDDPNTPQYKAADWMIYQNYTNDIVIISQRYVLGVLYYSTNGDFWDRCSANKTDRNTSTPCTNASNTTELEFPYLSPNDICMWYGSSCDTPGILSQLTLPSNNLNGIIPTELAVLRGLYSLDLSNNTLYGQIPFRHLSSLSNLHFLHLHENKLSGPITIPRSNVMYKSLQELTLNDNKLSGTLSNVITSLIQLKTLDLSKNALTGTLPSNMDKLIFLEKIELASNSFRGVIPSSIASNTQLWYAAFNFNNFTGTMPLCQRNISFLIADCEDELAINYVACDCCTKCCNYVTQTCTENNKDTIVT